MQFSVRKDPIKQVIVSWSRNLVRAAFKDRRVVHTWVSTLASFHQVITWNTRTKANSANSRGESGKRIASWKSGRASQAKLDLYHGPRSQLNQRVLIFPPPGRRPKRQREPLRSLRKPNLSKFRFGSSTQSTLKRINQKTSWQYSW